MNIMPRKPWAKWCFFASLGMLLFGYGFITASYKVFPYSLISMANEGWHTLMELWKPGPSFPKNPRWELPIYSSGEPFEMKLLLARHTENWDVEIVVIDFDGRIWHRWLLDVHALKARWDSDPERLNWRTSVEEERLFVHGMALLPCGDLVFNLENLAMVRMQPDGEIVWFKSIKSHHSMELDLDGNIWTCGAEKVNPGSPANPWIDQSILKLDTNGNILQYWSLTELLQRNQFHGLAYPEFPDYHNDRYHVNDADPYVIDDTTGRFNRFDILVSLRNANAIFVFNTLDSTIKYFSSGHFTRQHDPDFIDGNRISVFDNRFVGADPSEPTTRIITINAMNNTLFTNFIDSSYCMTMGRLQWLVPYFVLITNPHAGRTYVVSKEQKVVWAHNYYLPSGARGKLLDARVLKLPIHSTFDTLPSDSP
ncbi:MAG: aryl-sulfate sulfotransferase [Bacteroidetes bacterium]|nr:aryl-sulfate sulfotransferase [Bacteroidota bacterium]